ncbi:gamma-glutamylcyclotransferase [Thermosulfurimonas marina]|uniref:Gamma-glutamylcyclotransferase family protein n=1 Tax=Thermosulfurimonas marina TaxID=2047767 RepID=A0A6H1WRJ2_9BACT|nr:gamma-glutamylcyclotransferase family protein [Thermosulfurimonas marina]QJA05774.1 gamma-glutamylcyclotransferase [Thermosulfurimonas marina]
MPILFVYGTLRRGQPLHGLLRGASLMGEGWVEGFALYDLGDYPAARPWEKGRIWGELYAVPEELLPLLDQVEDEYRRETVLVECSSGAKIPAQMYVYRDPLPESQRLLSERWERSSSS